MNLRASATFRAGDFARLEAKIVPLLTTGAENASAAVLEVSQQRVPVDTGYLKSTGSTTVEWKGHKVTGYVSYGAYYAAYVEFGIRQRGAAGEWTGPFSYSEGNGFAGFGYLRGAIDIARPQALAAFKEALGV